MAYSNFTIGSSGSTLNAGGSGIGFNAPGLPNLQALFNRFRPGSASQNEDWKMKYLADKERYDRNYKPAKDDHTLMMERLQEREALNQIQAKEQGPQKVFLNNPVYGTAGWVMAPQNENAYGRQHYVPANTAAGGQLSPSAASLMADMERPPAPQEPETPLNSRRLNDVATSQRTAGMTSGAQQEELIRMLSMLLGKRG